MIIKEQSLLGRVFFKKCNVKLCIIVILAVVFRLLVMCLGYNFDFQSYLIVGKICAAGGNVYTETARYNYSPLFSIFLGCIFGVSSFFHHSETLFRVLLVLTLTGFDVGIGFILLKRFNLDAMALFLLNPITIIITGYHNQFDNIAVFFALLGVLGINTDKKFSRQDGVSIVFLSLSLMIKHILFIFPAWILLKDGFPFRKKLAYSLIPPFVFLMSFIPYLENGWSGILHNVFLYRSFNNFPLLNFFFAKFVGEDYARYYFYIYVMAMLALGYIIRKKSFDKIIVFYFLGLVSFSSAIANQYLSIPAYSLCATKGYMKYMYFIIIGLYLNLDTNGLCLYQLFPDCYFAYSYMKYFYPVAAWILLAVIFSSLIASNTGDSRISKIAEI